MPDAGTAAVCLAVLVADTGIDARSRYFSEIADGVLAQCLADLLEHAGAIGMHDDSRMRLRLVGGPRQLNIIDAGLDRPGLVHLAGGPLSALLVLQQALPVHDQDSLLHQYAPVYR